MEIFKTIDKMREWSLEQKRTGKRIAFVPTMGALHEGHLSLLSEGKQRADVLVMSIYVNPTQFSSNQDLHSYPQDLNADLLRAEECGVDAVFLPDNEVMYPARYQTRITMKDLTRNLCGASRPDHFQGVATIVAKLFNIVMPDLAIFGEKDFQQLVVIRRMVSDLNMPIEVIGCPTVREADGLAMSSRNRNLNAEERVAAQSINQSLGVVEQLIDEGETNMESLIATARETIESSKIPIIDYVKLVNADTLEDLSEFRRPALLAVAAFVGKARLIDNRIFPEIQ